VELLEPEPSEELSGEPDVPAESAEPPGRRYPSTIGGLLYLVVLGTVGIALVVVARGEWRLGVRWIGGSLVFAAVARLVLPSREAGMLAVRRRWIDVTILTVLGVALWVLAVTIPNQPPL
jgi:hypothetical protein